MVIAEFSAGTVPLDYAKGRGQRQLRRSEEGEVVTEGLDTGDLVEAKALLDELR